MSEGVRALRGDALSVSGDPFLEDPGCCLEFIEDALIVLRDGKIESIGPASAEALAALPAGVEPQVYRDALILPGFLDAHVHYPQTQVLGASGKPLLDWLASYTFPAEQAFANGEHAARMAEIFLREALRHGTTTAGVFCTVHPGSVDAFFEASSALGMRNIAGKVLMDREAPQGLLDTPERGEDESRALIERWHGKGRQLYALTPRFAITSSAEQLARTGALWREHPGVYLQSHLAENDAEIARVAELFPARRDYLDVYAHHGLLGPRAIYGHGIHLGEDALQRCHDTQTAIAHCPTSNLFLGSGLFDLARAKDARRPLRVALATDIGGGSSFSMLRSMAAASEIAQLSGSALHPAQALHLATRGAAEALCLDDKLGSLEPGKEADLVVLDLHATPLMRVRMEFATSLEERLAVLMTLGDDRAVRATWVNGACAHDRDEGGPDVS